LIFRAIQEVTSLEVKRFLVLAIDTGVVAVVAVIYTFSAAWCYGDYERRRGKF
jgi:hypothetical protein